MRTTCSATARHRFAFDLCLIVGSTSNANNPIRTEPSIPISRSRQRVDDPPHVRTSQSSRKATSLLPTHERSLQLPSCRCTSKLGSRGAQLRRAVRREQSSSTVPTERIKKTGTADKQCFSRRPRFPGRQIRCNISIVLCRMHKHSTIVAICSLERDATPFQSIRSGFVLVGVV